ncbi:MAG: sugar phosphate isomerase/epimerase [Promethearchaeota archaeon]|nr:MAG: sugar phosphate isomerase/epimerase [Candidatus Lokiarchaeota archaeon]
MENLALNQQSYQKSDLLYFIQFAKKFQGLELNYKSIKDSLSNKITLKDIFQTLNSHNLKMVNLFQLKDFSLCSDNKFKVEIIPTLKEMINYCYKLESDLITVSPSFESRDIPQWKIIRRTKEKLKLLAKIAYKEDIKLGFEFINLPNSSIPSLKEAKKVMKPLIAQENLGYIIDTFYLEKSGENVEDLIDIFKSAAQIYLIQLADVQKKEKQDPLEINEAQRIIPGRGSFDFKDLFEKVYQNRYRGYYSIELHKKPFDYNIFHRFITQIRSIYNQ